MCWHSKKGVHLKRISQGFPIFDSDVLNKKMLANYSELVDEEISGTGTNGSWETSCNNQQRCLVHDGYSKLFDWLIMVITSSLNIHGWLVNNQLLENREISQPVHRKDLPSCKALTAFPNH